MLRTITLLNLHWKSDRIFSNKLDNCLLIIFSKFLDKTGKMVTGLKFSFLFLLPFLKIRVTLAIFRKEENLEFLNALLWKMQIHLAKKLLFSFSITARKVSKYGVFPYFATFVLNTERYSHHEYLSICWGFWFFFQQYWNKRSFLYMHLLLM